MAAAASAAAVVRMQAIHLAWLFLSMKRWKFIWMAVVLLSLLSNHVFFPIVDSWTGTLGQTYVDLGAKEFTSRNLVLAQTTRDSEQLGFLTSNLKEESADASSLLESCSNEAACEARIFQVLYGRIDTSKFTNYIAFNGLNGSGDGSPHIQCQMAHGGEMNCPYLGSLASISQRQETNEYRFKEVRFFSLVSRKEGKKVNSQRGQGTKCAQHENFELVYSRAAMLQCMLIAGTVAFYFLVSTQSCIAELKSDGFLQLMFQKGLSVKAYWLVVGGITLAEVAAFSIVYIISLAVQCPGFFNPLHMVAVFIMSLFYLLSVTALGVLFTVTLGSYFYVGLLTVLVAILSMTLMLLMRLLFGTMVWLKFVFLFVFPLGHFSEFVQGAMLAEIRLEPLGGYNITILVVTVLLPVLLSCAILQLDYTHPAGNGFCLPRNFCMRREFWADSLQETRDKKDDPLYGTEPEPSANVEPVAESLLPLVRLSELSKTFVNKPLWGQATEFVAIKNMSGLIYENHITAIIGHNGAGKTTFLNLLTGVEQPTTGRVTICGVLATCPLIRQRLRGKLGICPQALSFAGGLTVEQTMRLTVASCGCEWEQSRDEVEYILQVLRLDKKRDQILSSISSGHQRKLAVGMALLGNPRVLFLDEPTSGLDPESRRRMWKLLQKYRMGRSIIMSTQFMDEADTLADWKIFLSGGSLICAGSSLFLKSAFDCGFVYQVTLKNEKHLPLLKRQICDEFKSVRARNKFGANINFHLPAKDIDFLPSLTQALEKRMELISAFGLLQASLYDIFMRLKDLDAATVATLFSNEKDEQVELHEDTPDPASEPGPKRSQLTSIFPQVTERRIEPSLWRQFRAIIAVNLIRLLRTRIRLACRVIVPAILLLALITTATIERSNANHKMKLRNNMTNDGGSIDSGVCVFEETPGNVFSIVDAQRCMKVFIGRNRPPMNPTRFLALQKDEKTSLADFLQNKEVVSQIHTKCRSKAAKDDPCPIVYTPHWYSSESDPKKMNQKRVLYVGTYSLYESFNSTMAASISIGAFQRAVDHFADEYGRAFEFYFSAESVYDYRSTLVPTLGTFFQIIILAFLPATFLDDIIEDKTTQVRFQLASMGMGCLSYWLTNSLIHWLQYSIIYSVTTLLLLAIVQIGYSSTYYILGVYVPTLIIGLPCNQLMVYVLSTLQDKANHLITIMYFFFAILLSMIILIVQLNNVVSIILIALLPPYAVVALTFYGVKTVFYTLSFYEKESIGSIATITSKFFFSQPHVLAAFVAVIVHTIVLLLLLMTIENRVMLQQILETHFRPTPVQERDEQTDDPGVLEELERVNNNPRGEGNIMEVRHMRKTYGAGIKVVRDVTFATGPAEIVGMLGPNGAGKTTTMSMMVGHLKASGGRCEVRYNDTWLPSSLAASRGAIGYCPQYDPLYGCVSATEHLQFYASILGVPQDKQAGHVNDLVTGLGLDTINGKMASQLSVGSRRRLSLAIALLGEPTVVVIDEATTGVDPEGKRFLWQAIRTAASIASSVIVSTHSMEEVEALCDKAIVLNRGLMVGLGTVQQLRTRYGRSYSLEILIRSSVDEVPDEMLAKKNTLVEAVKKKFANTSVIEEFNDRVHFEIPVTSTGRLSVALSWLVDNKRQLAIHYFSFHQMSMDQVFRRMVKVHEKLMKFQRRRSMFSLSADGSDSTVGV